MDEKTAIDAEASTQEKSPPKPEKSPITRGKSGKAVAASRQEKSPSKPQRSPIVTRGRSTKSVEAFKKKLSTVVPDQKAASRQEKSPSKPQRSPIVTRGRSTKSVEAFKKKLSTVVPDQKGKNVLKKKRVTPKISNLPITRGKSRKAVAASRQEKCPSKPEQSQIVTRGNSTKSVEAFKKKLSTVVPDQKGKNVLKKKWVTRKISNLPITRGKSKKAVAASRQEKCPSKPEQSQIVTRGNSTKSVEAFKKKLSTVVPDQKGKNVLKKKRVTPKISNLPITRGKSRKAVAASRHQSSIQSPMDEKTAIDAEASTQEKSPPKPEKSPITRGKSGKAVAASRQEKSPSKPQRSPIVTNGRSTKSVEAFKKKLSTVVPDQKGKNVLKKKRVTPKISNLPITRGKSRKAVAASRQEKCPSKPEQSQIVTRGNSTKSVEAFDDNLSTVEAFDDNL
ncbi:hypothetical protein TNCT_432051 [Trichonephila clavata]|uniref:Uncharacterized protein n=1 Tax=Trichonephila clavata TaxID=2740835 RepID=A0A8X6M6L1_TRICU|nr:hypothetical protein TNCT_432051 [Trichonephila clavata]